MKRFFFLLILGISFFGFSNAQKKPSPAKTTKPVAPKQTPIPLKKAPKEIGNNDSIPDSTKLLEIGALPKFEQEIFAELSLVRSDPAAYAKFLVDYLNTYEVETFKDSNGVRVTTIEGRKPVLEAIETLKKTSKLPEFRISQGLTSAAFDHVADLGKNNKTGHFGSDGKSPVDRAAKYGKALAGVNENISYGTKTARDVVITMLVDDGTANRNHRKNVLNPQLRLIGLATGESKRAGVFCVLVLTHSFFDKIPSIKLWIANGF